MPSVCNSRKNNSRSVTVFQLLKLFYCESRFHQISAIRHSLDINLKSGKSENSHIILHLSCRFYEDVIVRNSWTPNGWDVEEREQNLNEFTMPNPIVAGDAIKSTNYFNQMIEFDSLQVTISKCTFSLEKLNFLLRSMINRIAFTSIVCHIN